MIVTLLLEDDGSIQKTQGIILVQARALRPVLEKIRACSSVECSEVLTMGNARRVERGRRVERDCLNEGFESLFLWKWLPLYRARG
jgi:hypothetical protein